MRQEDKDENRKRKVQGTMRNRKPIVIEPRRQYRGAEGASIGDVPERAAFDRGARVTK